MNIEGYTLVSVTLSRWGAERRADVDLLPSNIDHKMVKVLGKILDCDELNAIINFDGRLRQGLRKLKSVAQFKHGIYAVPNHKLSRFVTEIIAAQATRSKLVQQLISVYPEKIASNAPAVREYWTGCYPSVEWLREQFGFSWNVVLQGLPEAGIEGIDATIVAAISAQHEQEVRHFVAELKDGLLETFRSLVDGMINKLTPDEESGKRRFSTPTTRNLLAWIEEFDLLNIPANYTALHEQVVRARAVLNGVGHLALRSDDTIANAVQGGLRGISEALSEMTTINASTRIFKLN